MVAGTTADRPKAVHDEKSRAAMPGFFFVQHHLDFRFMNEDISMGSVGKD
ncbi:hypothetical protein [Sphingomonas abietis]|uniref:Uncharacterized protein n=1 Tax=Sphingomonas abietis TaxID=3012344 RepID=A0ABY7NK53_9SPHN|nr:hypothetical protein [Sphingomonas abietis]WBO21878.1 hypothetical protein PBT88_17180 [Sphingomonas abietis]